VSTDGTNLGASGVPTRETGRDLSIVRAAFEEWLRGAIGDPTVSVDELQAPDATGVANETVLCSTTGAGELVIRVESPDYLYKDADLAVHASMCRALGPDPAVPVPEVIGFADDTSIFGGRFYVMQRLPGEAAPDNPPYHSGGWVADAPVEVRRSLWERSVDVMAALHATPLERVRFLDDPRLGASGLEQDLTRWRGYQRWALAGRPSPVIEAAERWLVDNRPACPTTSLSWGDARMGNMLFVDGDVTAVLDWDMVGLAGPESDLAWWTIMELLYTVSAGVPVLEGIGTPEDTVRRWEQTSGRAAVDLGYHLVFAAYRMANILTRLSDLLQAQGLFDDDLAADMCTNNSGIQYLAGLLDLDHPGPYSTRWPGLDLDLDIPANRRSPS
jgi:aminoglycoside phosphotransferase (APT) family kinase protein